MTFNTQSLFQTLQLDLTQLDDERIQARNSMLIRSLIHLPPFLVCIGLTIWMMSQESVGLGFLAMVAAVGFFIWWIARVDSVRKGFAKSFKEKVIRRMIAKIDAGFTYCPENQKHIPSDPNPLVAQINNSKILPQYNKCWIEDVISGTVRENKFDFMELKMENGTGKQRKTVFQGIALTVSLNASFPSNIYIYPNLGNELFSGLLTLLNLNNHPAKAVKLNHPQFEKVFKVFCDDDQALVVVLNNTVLERLLKIHEKITEMSGIKNSVSFSFVQNSITIAVKLRTNLFEPRITKPINDIEYFESNANYLVMFLGLIDDLNISR
jgi:hypothetical protein